MNEELKPVLIVTCKAGSEEWCEEEIGNVLFQYDPHLKIARTRHRGLLLVYSRLEPYIAYTHAINSEYGFVQHIIPVNYVSRFNLENLERVKDLVGYGEKVRVKLRIRGVRGLSRIVWKKIIDLLASKRSKHDPRSNMCLYVEVIDDTLFLGKSLCK